MEGAAEAASSAYMRLLQYSFHFIHSLLLGSHYRMLLQRAFGAAQLPRRTSRSPLKVCAASAKRKVTIRGPNKTSPYVLHSQADLERALGAEGCPGGVLVDDATQTRTCRFADVVNGGTYAIQQQPAQVLGLCQGHHRSTAPPSSVSHRPPI
jgi:hypothetical protein